MLDQHREPFESPDPLTTISVILTNFAELSVAGAFSLDYLPLPLLLLVE